MESRTPLPGVNERDGSVLGCGRMSCFGGRLVDQPRLLIFSAARGGREVCVMIGAVDVAIRYRNLNSHAKFIPFSSICGHDFSSSSYSQRLRIVSRIISHPGRFTC